MANRRPNTAKTLAELHKMGISARAIYAGDQVIIEITSDAAKAPIIDMRSEIAKRINEIPSGKVRSGSHR